MQEKEKKPRIRFKGFTEAWEQRKVIEFGELVTGTTPSTSDADNYNGDYLFVSPADIQGNRFVENTITTLSEKGFYKCRNLKADSVLFVSIGSTIGKVAQIKEIAVTNQQINAIVPNEKYNPNFIYSLLEKEAEDIKKQASAQAVPIINKTTFGEIECFVTTNKTEQTKISELLLSIDNLITLHQRKYDKLVNVKKALLEKMFPKNGSNVPEIRFKGFTEAWEQRKLLEVANYRNGKAHENDIDENGKYIVVNSKFVSTEGEIKKYSNKQNEPLEQNDIAFVLSDVPNGRAIAKTFLVDKSNKYTLNQRIAGITPHDNINPKYLAITMNRNKYFLQFDDGVKQTNLSLEDMKKYENFYPEKKEQDKLGNTFETIDNLITLHQRKLEKLKNIKKSLLEKMFV